MTSDKYNLIIQIFNDEAQVSKYQNSPVNSPVNINGTELM